MSAAGATVALAVAGCTVKSVPEPSPAAISARRGGVLVRRSLRNGVFARGLDPHIQPRSSTALMGLFYQALVRLDLETLEIGPGLASKWESPSAGTLVLSLQPNVFWHDKPPLNGRLLTASDVVHSLQRVRGSDPTFLYSSLLSSVERIEAVDSRTVKLTLNEPDVALLNNLATPSWAVIAPETMERFEGKFTTAESAIGTGAFVVDSMDETSMTLRRHGNYWRAGLPYVDGIRLVDLREPQTLWSAFLAKQLDLAHPPGAEARKLDSEGGQADTRFAWVPDEGHQQISFNTRRRPFDDSRVTRALRLLLDHDEAMTGWAEVWFGRGYLGSYLPAALHDWDIPESDYRSQFLEWRQPKHQAAQEALSLLGAAGYSRRNALAFSLPVGDLTGAGKTMAELIQAQYRKYAPGTVEPTLKVVDSATRDALYSSGDFDQAVGGITAPNPYEPGAWFQVALHSKSSRNYGKFSDPVLDGMIDRQRSIFDVAQRKEAIRSLIRFSIDRAPYVGWCGYYSAIAWHGRVHGLQPETEGNPLAHQYEQLWLDT